MSSLPFIVVVASSAQAFPFECFCSRRACRLLPFVAIFAMPAVPLPLFTLQALVPSWCCRFLNSACKFLNAFIFLFVFCLFTRSAQRLVFSFRHGSAFRLSAAKLTVHLFHEKKFRKHEKNFQKIDKILKTILTLPFCQSIIMVEKYIRKQRAHGRCKK